MIIKSSTGYWSTGITVQWHEHAGSRTVDGQRQSYSGWGAGVEYFDDGFCDDNPDEGQVSTQGRIATRYRVPDGDQVSGLSAAIDAVLADAQRLGITFRDDTGGPSLYYAGDGEHDDKPAPEGWEVLLATESARIGWNPIYT